MLSDWQNESGVKEWKKNWTTARELIYTTVSVCDTLVVIAPPEAQDHFRAFEGQGQAMDPAWGLGGSSCLGMGKPSCQSLPKQYFGRSVIRSHQIVLRLQELAPSAKLGKHSRPGTWEPGKTERVWPECAQGPESLERQEECSRSVHSNLRAWGSRENVAGVCTGAWELGKAGRVWPECAQRLESLGMGRVRARLLKSSSIPSIVCVCV